MQMCDARDIACHMKIPKCLNGQERYSNLILLHRDHLPLVTEPNADMLKKYCNLQKLKPKHMTKINALRTAAKLHKIH